MDHRQLQAVVAGDYCIVLRRLTVRLEGHMTAGQRQERSRRHLTVSAVREMSAHGTKLPIWDVRSLVATKGKPDIAQEARFGSA